MIIDSHAHIYPDKLARKAARSIGDFYDIDMDLDGTVDMLLKVGDEAGVDKFLVHSVATTPHQVRSINSFIAKSVSEHPTASSALRRSTPDAATRYRKSLTRR